MYVNWPLGKLNDDLSRPELKMLTAAGYRWDDPADVVELFEKKVAKFAGAKYGVAVDSCSHGLFLCLKYLNAYGIITLPAHTYASVPMQILHARCQLKFENRDWSGMYQLYPYPIWDAAVRWQEGMYRGGFHVTSFQIKKRIPIGRGGMILTDDDDAVEWLRRARYDGRTPNAKYNNDVITTLGWHYYMTPEDAARGILLMDAIPGSYPDSADSQYYPDLREKFLI